MYMPVVVVAIRTLFCEADAARASISSVSFSDPTTTLTRCRFSSIGEALDPGVGFE
jgi:hypothetical protein